MLSTSRKGGKTLVDTNPRRAKSLKYRVILFILVIVAVVVVCLQVLRDWVAGDMQGRLGPATAMIVVPFVSALLIYTFREGFKPRRRHIQWPTTGEEREARGRYYWTTLLGMMIMGCSYTGIALLVFFSRGVSLLLYIVAGFSFIVGVFLLMMAVIDLVRDMFR